MLRYYTYLYVTWYSVHYVSVKYIKSLVYKFIDEFRISFIHVDSVWNKLWQAYFTPKIIPKAL